MSGKHANTLEAAGYVFEPVTSRTPFGQRPPVFSKNGNATLVTSAAPAVPSVAEKTTLAMPQGSVATRSQMMDSALPSKGTMYLIAAVAIIAFAVFYNQ